MTTTEVMSTGIRETFVSPKSGVTLTVSHRSFGIVPDERIQDVVDGKVPPVEITGSQDGRGMVRGVWHDENTDGPFNDGVWVERWSNEGCEFHGVVDSVSRKVVQVG